MKQFRENRDISFYEQKDLPSKEISPVASPKKKTVFGRKKKKDELDKYFEYPVKHIDRFD